MAELMEMYKQLNEKDQAEIGPCNCSCSFAAITDFTYA